MVQLPVYIRLGYPSFSKAVLIGLLKFGLE